MAIFNFRADRVVEISKAFEYKDFKNFDRKRWPDVSALSLLVWALMANFAWLGSPECTLAAFRHSLSCNWLGWKCASSHG